VSDIGFEEQAHLRRMSEGDSGGNLEDGTERVSYIEFRR